MGGGRVGAWRISLGGSVEQAYARSDLFDRRRTYSCSSGRTTSRPSRADVDSEHSLGGVRAEFARRYRPGLYPGGDSRFPST